MAIKKRSATVVHGASGAAADILRRCVSGS